MITRIPLRYSFIKLTWASVSILLARTKRECRQDVYDLPTPAKEDKLSLRGVQWRYLPLYTPALAATWILNKEKLYPSANT